MIASRVRKSDKRKVYDVRLRDPQGRQYSRTFETQAGARAFEASERSDQRRGRWVDPRRSEAKFSEVAAGWLEASAHKRASSIERDRAIISRHLLPVLGGRRLASITPTEIQRIVNAWTAKGAPATVARQYATCGRSSPTPWLPIPWFARRAEVFASPRSGLANRPLSMRMASKPLPMR